MRNTKDFMLLENRELKSCPYVGNDKLIYPPSTHYLLSSTFEYYQYLVPFALFTYIKILSIRQEDFSPNKDKGLILKTKATP